MLGGVDLVLGLFAQSCQGLKIPPSSTLSGTQDPLSAFTELPLLWPLPFSHQETILHDPKWANNAKDRGRAEQVHGQGKKNPTQRTLSLLEQEQQAVPSSSPTTSRVY